MLDWLIGLLGVADLGLLQGLVFAGLAFSVVLSLLTLDFPDLSIEGTFPLGAAVTAVALGAGWPVPFAFLLAALCGAAGGVQMVCSETINLLAKAGDENSPARINSISL
jgi:putative ABC transport system permease protein